MTSDSFFSDPADIEREIGHKQGLIRSHQRNKDLLEQIIAKQGVANVDLYFRKLSLEDDITSLNNQIHDLESRKRELDIDRNLQISTTVLYTHLPSGILEYYDAQTMPLLQYEIVNNTADTITCFIHTEIEDFSFGRDDVEENIAPNEKRILYQLPRLKFNKAKELTEMRRAVIHSRIECWRNGVQHLLRLQSYEIFLLARNVIRWAVPNIVQNSGNQPLLEHIAAWVTPHVEPVKHMLRNAIKYRSDKTLWGYQGTRDPLFVREQVKAIFLALKNDGQLAYINSPFAVGPRNGEERQTVRLPRESLSERSANCIDGAVLYASLLEQADLKPVIVVQTGHAFVGWRTWDTDNTCEFLEGTMTLTDSFEVAFQEGMAEYQKLTDNGWFNREVFAADGFARLLDIKQLHTRTHNAIHPME